MKILVTVKRVPDPRRSIKVNADGTGIVTDNIKWVVNPFDEIAIEEALRIKEKDARRRGRAGVASARRRRRSSCAPASPWAPIAPSSSSATRTSSRSPSRACCRSSSTTRSPTWSCMGKQAIDDDSNGAGQMLAELLGWPQATFASKVEIAGDQKSATVTREVDGGLETLERSPLPGDRHRRPAPERAALRVAARHHEGAQEGAEGDPGRPTSASTSRPR